MDLAKDFIENYGPLVVHAFQESLSAWFQTILADGCEHKNRTKSNYIWDTFFHKLRSILPENGNLHFVDAKGTTFIIYKQIFLIRMKKLGQNKRASYIKTNHAEKFQYQLSMGFGDLVNVYLFYSLDRYGVTFDSIKLQCEKGNVILWSFPIDNIPDIKNLDLFDENQKIPDNRIRIKESHKKGNQNGKAV
jgi:hypothetical protein